MKKQKFGYVDGFIFPVKKQYLSTYLKWAKLSAKVWIEHGALDYVECQADDVQKGKVTSFPRSVKLKAGELVFFSWATYKSRKHRDQVMKKVFMDSRMAGFMELMESKESPMDGMRMFWGGFTPVVSVRRAN